MKKTLPSIQILKAIHPEDIGHRLLSPMIEKQISQYDRVDYAAQLKAAKKGSLEFEAAVHQLDSYSFLKASQKLSSSDPELRGRNRDLWVERFNARSVKLYGDVELCTAVTIADRQYQKMQPHSSKVDPGVLEIYRLASKVEKPDSGKLELKPQDKNDLAAVFKTRMADWLKLMDDHEDNVFYPPDLVAAMNKFISIRSVKDDRWLNWQAKLQTGLASVKVNRSAKKIYVGVDRVPSTKKEATLLGMHELGVHVQRAINGASVDKSLFRGLPGYIDIEEQLGILSEYLIGGQMPNRADDRYFDAALALGTLPDIQLTRSELIDFVYERSMSRLRIKDIKITAKRSAHKVLAATTHVNRLYRGGDGLDDEVAAVFTRDTIYYPEKIIGYINEQLQEGCSPTQIIDYLMIGKFDPTSKAHREHVAHLLSTVSATA